jgi:hypothetical protein
VAVIEDRSGRGPWPERRRAISDSDSDLEGMLSAGGTPVDIVPQLLDAALTRATRDNVTAVRVCFHEE